MKVCLKHQVLSYSKLNFFVIKLFNMLIFIPFQHLLPPNYQVQEKPDNSNLGALVPFFHIILSGIIKYWVIGFSGILII